MVKQISSQAEKDYQLFLDERKLLIEGIKEGARTFDKAILALASGAFGVTVAFMKDIAPHPFPNTLCLLGWSWGLFSLSLVLILFSFLSSQKACKEQIDVSYNVIVLKKEEKTIWTMVTTILNISSIIALIGAIILWGTFAYWNLH
ncbi:MAG TPA: hypothetical protein PK595_09190 [Bacteroidota bacterium]|nr:hypothetical protein [Bacteroidota bacterium]